MKNLEIKLILFTMILFLFVGIVSADRVGYVVDFQNGNLATGCIDVPSNSDGFDTLEASDLSLVWSPEGDFGHFLCQINGVGDDVVGLGCEFTGSFWNFHYQTDDGNWEIMPVGHDGPGNCWTTDGGEGSHYCSTDGDVMGWAYGEWITSPAETFTFDELCNILFIEEVDIEVDGDNEGDEDGGSIDVEPGSEVEIMINIENIGDIDLEDVQVEVILEDINDGDDLDYDTNKKDISPGKDREFNLDFNIPIKLDDDEYDMVLVVTARDENGVDYELEILYDLDVDKEKHEVVFGKIGIRRPDIECRDPVNLDVEIINTGEDDEEVELNIYSKSLGFDGIENVEIDSGDYYKNSYQFKTESVTDGLHEIDLIAAYSSDSSRASVQVNVEGCQEKKSTVNLALTDTTTDNTDLSGIEVVLQQSSYKQAEEFNWDSYSFIIIAGVGILIGILLLLTMVLVKR